MSDYTRSSTAKRKIAEVAREYERLGYSVVVNPESSDIPAFLSSFHPDIVATNDAEHVVIEVRSRDRLTDPQENISELAETIDRHPGWRFELVVTNPRNTTQPILPDRVLSTQEIGMRIGMARELLEDGQPELAALVVSSATEAVLLRIASSHRIKTAHLQPSKLLKQLYVAGLLDENDYEALKRAIHERDLVAHGLQPDSPTEAWVPSLIEITSSLAYGGEREAVA